jgi:hypothetical protein
MYAPTPLSKEFNGNQLFMYPKSTSFGRTNAQNKERDPESVTAHIAGPRSKPCLENPFMGILLVYDRKLIQPDPDGQGQQKADFVLNVNFPPFYGYNPIFVSLAERLLSFPSHFRPFVFIQRINLPILCIVGYFFTDGACLFAPPVNPCPFATASTDFNFPTPESDKNPVKS